MANRRAELEIVEVHMKGDLCLTASYFLPARILTTIYPFTHSNITHKVRTSTFGPEGASEKDATTPGGEQ
jgi:hypothetical protein